MIRASLITLALGLSTLAQAEPSYHRVVGVAIDDVLNVRSEPSGSSVDIGDLAYDARRIEAFEFDATGN